MPCVTSYATRPFRGKCVAVCQRYKERFNALLVDEFQDTSSEQLQLLQLLATDRTTVCGDEDQSIYSFRGSASRPFSQFKLEYPASATYMLQQNFRSTQTIVAAAAAVIRSDPKRPAGPTVPKNVWTANAEGNPVYIINAATPEKEATIVGDDIQVRAGMRVHALVCVRVGCVRAVGAVCASASGGERVKRVRCSLVPMCGRSRRYQCGRSVGLSAESPPRRVHFGSAQSALVRCQCALHCAGADRRRRVSLRLCGARPQPVDCARRAGGPQAAAGKSYRVSLAQAVKPRHSVLQRLNLLNNL